VKDDRFEWDDDKARANVRKHGVSFELARAAFDDPGFLDVAETDPDEERYNRLCMINNVILVVTFVERGWRIRIISARRAERHEQRTYFEQ
jgi:uncharacterized DUF497 family protein